jgi:hypothetical protein
MAAILLFSILQEYGPSRSSCSFQRTVAMRSKCDRLVNDTVYSGRCSPSFTCICREDGGSVLLQNLAKHLPDCTLSRHRRPYSKPLLIRLQLIQVSDNLDRNMKNVLRSWVCTLKDTWHLGRQMSHLSVEAKLDSFFKPALLQSKASTTSESSIDE